MIPDILLAMLVVVKAGRVVQNGKLDEFPGAIDSLAGDDHIG